MSITSWCRARWATVSNFTAERWIAIFTGLLAFATAALAYATFSLVASTDQLAKAEKKHGDEEWRRVVNATIGQLSSAINASTARRVCARYVIAADVENGIRAEDAGRAAHERELQVDPAKLDADFILKKSTGVTNSLLEAVVGNIPLADNYNFALQGTQYASLAGACLSSLFDDGDLLKISSKPKGTITSRLHKELVGYQNAVESAAGLSKNVELPHSAQNSLTDNLVGALDSDTRMFLEATTVYMFFSNPDDPKPELGKDLVKLKEFAVSEFKLCDKELKFDDKPIGQCFEQKYGAKPFLSVQPEPAKQSK